MGDMIDMAVKQAKAIADAEQRGEQGGQQQIPIGPVPTLVGLGQAEVPTPVPDEENEGQMKMVVRKQVVISFSTACGVAHYFLPADQTKNLAKAMEQAAAACESGMWLPGHTP
jgi:hypothetical protein